MTGPIPDRLESYAKLQAGVITRKQALKSGMSSGSIDAKLRFQRWQQVYRGVYAVFTGTLPREAQLWAAVLHAGRGAVLSYESAGELQKLVDEPAPLIHLTIPAQRRVTPVPGLAIHVSDQGWRVRYPHGELPRTLVEDTIIDLCEVAVNVEDVHGWVTKAFGRGTVSEGSLLAFCGLRKKLRWKAEMAEVITAAAGGAHSVLEFYWDRDVERAHGLPTSGKQVRFTKKDGKVGFRDRVFEQWRVIIELDGKKAHPDEKRGVDKARDNAAAAEDGSQTLRYGWTDVRYEACETTVQVVKVLWQRGWRERPGHARPRARSSSSSRTWGNGWPSGRRNRCARKGGVRGERERGLRRDAANPPAPAPAPRPRLLSQDSRAERTAGVLVRSSRTQCAPAERRSAAENEPVATPMARACAARAASMSRGVSPTTMVASPAKSSSEPLPYTPAALRRARCTSSARTSWSSPYAPMHRS